MTGPTYLLPDLAERFGLELQGVATEGVSGVATLERAGAGVQRIAAGGPRR